MRINHATSKLAINSLGKDNERVGLSRGREKAEEICNLVSLPRVFQKVQKERKGKGLEFRKAKDSLAKTVWPFGFEEKGLCYGLICFCLRQKGTGVERK